MNLCISSGVCRLEFVKTFFCRTVEEIEKPARADYVISISLHTRFSVEAEVFYLEHCESVAFDVVKNTMVVGEG